MPASRAIELNELPAGWITAYFAATGHRIFLRTVAPAHFLRFRLVLTGGSTSCSLRLSHRGLGIAGHLCSEVAELLHTLLIVIGSLLYEVGLGVHKTLPQFQIIEKRA